MTAYVAVYSGAANTNMAVIPGSSEIRIAQVVFSGQELASSASSFGTGTVYRYSGGASGGTTGAAPVPLRQGATPASSTTKTGTVTGSGTGSLMFSQTGSGANDSYSNGTTTFFDSSYVLTFQPAFDLIVSPGAALWVQGSFGNGNTVFVFFEELDLSWPY